MRILLVEDDPALSFGVARALQREGWQVDTLGDGMSASAEGLIGGALIGRDVTVPGYVRAAIAAGVGRLLAPITSQAARQQPA